MPAPRRAVAGRASRHAPSVSARAIDAHGIDGPARSVSGHGQDRLHVGGEGGLQGLKGHQGVVAFLMVGELGAVHEVRLHVRPHQLRGARHQRLDGVGHVVGLVEHVGGVEARHRRKLGVHQLVEDEEELERLDGARVQVVVAVLAVVEMEAGQLSELDQAGDDHLDVDVGCVVPQVDQGEGPLPELADAVVARAPVVDHRRVEGRLVELVLDEEAPARRQGGIDLAHAVEVALQGLAQVELSGEVSAVADPDRVGARAQLHPQLQAVEVVLHRLAPNGRVGVAQAAELVRERLPGLVLERVGVHRVDEEPARLGEGLAARPGVSG